MSGFEIVASLICLTAIASYINAKFIKLPTSIGVTLVSLIISLLIITGGKFGFNIRDIAKDFIGSVSFDKTFLEGMLSYLLFAGALHINALELSKYKAIIISLATVSVLVSTVIVGYAMYGIVKLAGLNIPMSYCFVFGALISPTDPIAVISILKSLKAPKPLEIKIAGEALFNDGMGIVLFVIALNIATGAQKQISSTEIFLCFLQQGGGGALLGLALGIMSSYLIKTIDDYDTIIIITLAVVTGGYSLAHTVLDVSGPIAVVVAGLTIGSAMNKCKMKKDTIKHVDHFWELMDGVLNSILFVLIGLELLTIHFNSKTSLVALAAIFITILARWISISMPVSLLNQNRRFDSSILMIMTWGGLRGGISIALALSMTGEYRDFIVSITYAVVLFSIMVQGLTISPLVKSKIKNDLDEKLMLMHNKKPSCNV